jgi:hypothetical protein
MQGLDTALRLNQSSRERRQTRRQLMWVVYLLMISVFGLFVMSLLPSPPARRG